MLSRLESLEMEVVKLRANVAELRADKAEAKLQESLRENAELKSEIERLTKLLNK